MPVPSYLTSFVGREAELRSLRALLKESRLVTFVGPGGAGKTRLAAELVRRMDELAPDRIWWIDLTEITDGAAVGGAVVSGMDLPGQGPPVEVATAWIGESPAVMVLDNCEHVVAGAQVTADDLLRRCPKLTLIATSREALRSPAETVWNVDGLSDDESRVLFEARARQAAARFVEARTNYETVGEICRRVDALPLAIEIAAAQTSVMTPGEILSNLGARLATTPAPDRTAGGRQKTISATIDWSYRLLTEDEATLFRRLAVFHGGFDFEAAEAICGEGLSAPATEVLIELVRKSMVTRFVTDEGISRYRLLELPLAFAAERLDESGERDRLLAGHHAYFDAKVTGFPDPWLGPVPAEVIRDNEAWKRREISNLWAALKWARAHRDDLGLPLALHVVRLGLVDVSYARSWQADLVETSRPTGSLLVDSLGQLAWFAAMQGDHEENRRLSERMTAAARQLGDPIRLAMALNNLGISAQDYGDYETAAVMFSEADSLAAQARSPRIRMIMKNSVGMVSRLQGQHQRARHVLDDVITVARQTGDDMMLCGALDSIAPSLIALGEIELADRYWRESTSIARVISDHVVLLADLVGLAQVASIRQDDCRALRLAAGARAASARWSLSFDLDINSRCDATVAASRSRLGQAAAERCWNEGSALTDVALVQYALDHEARALDDSGPLTRRELEVVRLVAAGKTNRQIAAALFLSERGAEGHVERIRNKLGFHSRAEIAAWAVARGLVDTREKEKGTLAGPPSRTRKHRTL